MRALGVHASTTIESVSLMMGSDRSVRELAELLHPHPAVTEGLQDCVRMLMGTSIYKPLVFRSDLRLSRALDLSAHARGRALRSGRARARRLCGAAVRCSSSPPRPSASARRSRARSREPTPAPASMLAMGTDTNPRTLVGLVAVVVCTAFVACDIEEGEYDEPWDERTSEDAAAPDLTLAALIQNTNQLPYCGAGSVSVTVDEVNLGVGGVGQFTIHLLDAATGQPAAGAAFRPALAGNTSRTSTLTFNPYLGPCDVVQCVPGMRTYDLFIDGGNLWAESDESNNRLGTLTYTTSCSLPPICPPLVCPAPIEPPFEPSDG